MLPARNSTAIRKRYQHLLRLKVLPYHIRYMI
jgi:hypothetical protein